MTDLVLDIYQSPWSSSTKDSVPTLNRFDKYSRHARNPRFGRTNGHSTRFLLWIECDWYFAKSPGDQEYSTLVISSDLKIAKADKGSGVCPGVLCWNNRPLEIALVTAFLFYSILPYLHNDTRTAATSSTSSAWSAWSAATMDKAEGGCWWDVGGQTL